MIAAKRAADQDAPTPRRISDAVWQALIAAALAIVMAWMNLQTQAKVDAAAKKSAADTSELRVVAEETRAQAEAVKVQLNGVTEAHLVTNAAMANRVAELSEEPNDQVLADAATKAIVAHQEATDAAREVEADSRKSQEATRDAVPEPMP